MNIKSIILLSIFVIGNNFISAQSIKVTGKVSDQFGALPGAKVALQGTTIETATNVDGDFELDIDPGKYIVSASFVMYADQEEEVNLSAGDSIHLEFELQSAFEIEQNISVGTRSGARSLLESSVPVDIISPQTIAQSGRIELGQILNYIAPSFNSTYQTISDGTDHIDPVSLRGLGPDQVLVLIDGKRRHTSSLLNVNGTFGRGTVGTDFNAIPFGAVDRIEILRDGAAAQYGSDAIAGVINIVLKEQTGVTYLDTQLGSNLDGDGKQRYFGGNVGFEVGDGGFVNFTLEFRDRSATNRSGAYSGPVYTTDLAIDKALISERDFFKQTGFDGQRVMEVGNSDVRNISFFFNSEIPLTRVTSFYAHGGRNFRDGMSSGFYRFPKDSSRVVYSLYPDGFSPKIGTDIVDDAFTIGFVGVKNNWNIDFSNTLGVNTIDFNVLNSNNASLGDTSPTRFYSGGFRYSQNTTNLDVSRTFNWLYGVSIAFGAEMRIENYEISAGEEASWINGMDSISVGGVLKAREVGSQVFPGFQPENELNEYRTNNGWYLDTEAKLTDKLLAGLATRYESYSDFGNEWIWKASSRYRFTSDLSINAGYSTGFRAPSLHQLYFNNISTQFFEGDAVSVGTFNNNSTVAKAFGIESLRPELSRHFNAGVTSKLFYNFTFTVNLYTIKILNRIVMSGRFDEGFEFILNPLNVGAAQFFTNAFDTRTSGMDITTTFRSQFGLGELSSSLGVNFNKTQVDGQIRTSEELEGQQNVLLNREEVSRIESNQPNAKVVFLNSYKVGDFTIVLNNTYFGRVTYRHPEDNEPSNWVINSNTGLIETRDQDFSPKVITDLIFSWRATKNIKASIGGQNIFNVYPDMHTHSANISDGRFPYSRRVQQFGVMGAHYFAKITLRL
ncbi:TonB-dependent receptor [Reichenbachiella versicolor]|uniref:TonB-dependent receptor n=1 Tax=Reichenbachiella versicolor TaxID=1821036 RepID=UPI000D6DF3BD|nr:TonB-dependent receptor [Reichenbachiella versicolor]